MSEGAAARRAWWRPLLAVLVAGVAGWQLWPWLTADAEALAVTGALKDDAFFYSVLVDNHRRLGFFTLDSTMPTNGFQPLWMGLLMALAGLLPDVDPLVLVARASWVSYVAFCAGAVWLVSRAPAWRGALATGLLSGLLLLNRRFQDAVVEGLEVPLVLALLVGVLAVAGPLLEWTGAHRRRQALVGAALGLGGAAVFYGRTDLFFLAPALGGWAWWAAGRRLQGLVPLAAAGLAAALAVAPYLLWNLAEHGALVPISGRVKVHLLDSFYETSDAYWASGAWHGMLSMFRRWIPDGSVAAQVAATFGIFAGAQVTAWTPWGRQTLGDEVRVLGLVTLAHALWMHLGYREIRGYTSYYFAPEYLFAVWVAARLAAALPRRLGAAALVAYLLVTSAATWEPMDAEPSGRWEARVALAKQLPELTRGEPVGAFWPGVFAAFGGVPVTPLDGVIGSERWFEDCVKPEREIDCALERGVRWIVVQGDPKKLLGKRAPRVTEWSFLGQRRVWERRAELKVRKRRGHWVLLELRVAGD